MIENKTKQGFHTYVSRILEYFLTASSVALLFFIVANWLPIDPDIPIFLLALFVGVVVASLLIRIKNGRYTETGRRIRQVLNATGGAVFFVFLFFGLLTEKIGLFEELQQLLESYFGPLFSLLVAAAIFSIIVMKIHERLMKKYKALSVFFLIFVVGFLFWLTESTSGKETISILLDFINPTFGFSLAYLYAVFYFNLARSRLTKRAG